MTDDLKLVEKLENLLVVLQLTHQHFNTAELLPCITLARIGAAVKPLGELYEADHHDAITITRNELGVLLGYHPSPPEQQEPK